MNLEETVIENLRALPADKQQEVLDFVQFLYSSYGRKKLLRPANDLNYEDYGPVPRSRKRTSPRFAGRCGATSRGMMCDKQ